MGQRPGEEGGVGICLKNPGVIRRVNAILLLEIHFPRHFIEDLGITTLEECAEALRAYAESYEKMASAARELGIDFEGDEFTSFQAYHKLPLDPGYGCG